MKNKKLTAILMVLFLSLSLSACGGVEKDVETESTKMSDEETKTETEEQKEEYKSEEETESTERTESETESENTKESESQQETNVEELDPENRIYSTYPVFIEDFTLEDGVLTVTTADVNLADFPLPEAMEFMFSFPLAEDCKWMHPYVLDEENLLDTDFMYSLLSYELEGVVFDLNNYKDGKAPYESDEAFCTFHNVWTFTVENGKVTEVANTGFNDATTNDETTATVAEQNKVQETEPTATPQPVATPTPAPVHQHSYNSSVLADLYSSK